MSRIHAFPVLLLLSVACAPPENGTAGAGAVDCPTALPPPDLDPVADVAAARQYASQLSFHPGRPPYGQRRDLTIVTDSGPAPERRFGLTVTAEIRPEICSYLNDTTELNENNGRIVAMVVTAGPYRKLALPRDTSYLWVEDLVVTGSVGTAKGVIIPKRGGQPSVRKVRFEFHPQTGVNRAWAEARLLFTPRDDELWESCAKFGCCYLEEGQPSDTLATPGVSPGG